MVIIYYLDDDFLTRCQNQLSNPKLFYENLLVQLLFIKNNLLTKIFLLKFSFNLYSR